MNPEIAVELRDVSFSYGQRLVVENVNFEILQDDFLGLIGPNGGGKTTLVKLILGVLKPTSGEVRIFGEPVSRARTRIGYVPQYVRFDVDFPVTVREMVLMGRMGHVGIGRRYRKEDRDVAQAVMEQLDLTHLANRELKALSGGERQRVLVARALACEPDILLLDEPTANVDVKAEKAFYGRLRQLNETIPIVLVSHDLGFISAYLTRVAFMNTTLKIADVSDIHAHDLEELYHEPVKQISRDGE